MRNIMTASALGLVLTAPGLALAATSEQDGAEIDELKRQVAMLPTLLARIEQLERANAAAHGQAPPAVAALETRVAAVEESNDRQTDQLAQDLILLGEGLAHVVAEGPQVGELPCHSSIISRAPSESRRGVGGWRASP